LFDPIEIGLRQFYPGLFHEGNFVCTGGTCVRSQH
jgi:hypothetical protein